MTANRKKVYAVVDIRTLKIICTTQSAMQVAIALEPGTVYGEGTNEYAAAVHAMNQALSYSAKGWRPLC